MTAMTRSDANATSARVRDEVIAFGAIESPVSEDVLASRLVCFELHQQYDEDPCDGCLALLELELAYLEREAAA